MALTDLKIRKAKPQDRPFKMYDSLGEIDEAAAEVQAVRSGRAGTVRVGAVTGAAVSYIVPAIHELKRESENPEVRVEVAPSLQLMEDLLAGELDFILSRVPPGVDGKRFDILHGRIETLRFLVRADHPLGQRRNLGLDDMTGYPWIIQMRGMPIREAVDAAHMAAGVPLPRDVIDSASLLMMLAYLRSSDAISPVATEVSELLTDTKAGGLTALHLSEQITLSPDHLIRQKGRPLGPVANRLLDLVLAKLIRHSTSA